MKFSAKCLVALTLTSILVVGGCDKPFNGPTKDVCYLNRGDTSTCPTSLDLYLPEPSGQPAPVMVTVHGGGWGSGDKADAKVTICCSIVR